MRKFYILLLCVILSLSSITVSAGSILGGLNKAKEDIENGNIDSGQDTGEITDIMGNWSSMNNPDEETMQEGTKVINSTVGYVLTVIIMVFFAGLTLTTATDLLWIGVPPLRPILYDSVGATTNVNLSTSVMHGIAQNQAQMAQRAMMRGDMASASRYNNMSLRSEAEGNYRDANWFGNKERLDRALNKNNANQKAKCFISSELKVIANRNQVNVAVRNNAQVGIQAQGVLNSKSSLLKEYCKKRAVSLALFAVCTIVLTSSLFTDFGMNVGMYILNWLGF